MKRTFKIVTATSVVSVAIVAGMVGGMMVGTADSPKAPVTVHSVSEEAPAAPVVETPAPVVTEAPAAEETSAPVVAPAPQNAPANQARVAVPKSAPKVTKVVDGEQTVEPEEQTQAPKTMPNQAPANQAPKPNEGPAEGPAPVVEPEQPKSLPTNERPECKKDVEGVCK